MTENEINKIIQDAERNPADEYAEFMTDNSEDLRQIEKQCLKTGRLKIDEI